MMNHIETVGNVRVFSESLPDNSIKVTLMNGTNVVVEEVYFHTAEENAIADLFSKELDTYTEEWLWLNCLSCGLIKLSDNTYKTSDTDWFCRIDNTRYFKHFSKSEDEFVKDKNGKRIIDR